MSPAADYPLPGKEAMAQKKWQAEVGIAAPSLCRNDARETKAVPPVRKGMGPFARKTQREKKKEARASRSQGGATLHALISEVDGPEQPELNTVSEASRWMTVCQNGYTRIKSVLDSGATDSCAPDCVCARA